MATTQGPTGGTDFWATLGVDQEPAEKPAPPPPPRPVEPAPDVRVAGSADGEGAAATRPRTAAGGTGRTERKGTAAAARPAASRTQAEWAAMFSDENAAQADWTAAAEVPQAPEMPLADIPVEATESGESEAGESEAGESEAGKSEAAEAEPEGESQEGESGEGGPREAAAPGAVRASAPPADPEWIAAERIAASIEGRLAETWLEVIKRHTNGDEELAGRVYQVLLGQHLLGHLWRDEHVNEVHVRGTRVTVCAADGVYEVPGFQSRASARKAVAAIKAAQSDLGARVTQIGDSYVMNRVYDTGPGARSLVASGVVTAERVAQVREALRRLQTVTVTGPAARIVVRAFASLIPPGSRVFVGPHGVLPGGCLAVSGPLDADYVTGVRPGAVAEAMAAEGQLGALIANPETRFKAAVQLVVSGRSMAPEKVTDH